MYLPNVRWFEGEEGLAAGEDIAAQDAARQRFAMQLAGLADVFVNDAFGSWQPHSSTLGVTKFLPSYAGLLMQKECEALGALVRPKRPFLAVIAGSKLDTKIDTIRAIAACADHVMLGGVLYNAYLAAKFGVEVRGVDPRRRASRRRIFTRARGGVQARAAVDARGERHHRRVRVRAERRRVRRTGGGCQVW